MMKRAEELEKFYCGKRVLVTGHTGFKGSWLCALLSQLGAEVYGYSLEAPTKPSLFEILHTAGADVPGRQSGPKVSHIGDVRSFDELLSFYREVRPDCVFHLAAQPIVRESYRIPRETYETNVMGTVNLLECLRLVLGCCSFLNVTTDKVYLNEERPGYGYREEDKLDGYDPYSNSKSCSELVTHAYQRSFFSGAGNTAASGAAAEPGRDERSEEQKAGMLPAISTARAGNVIGGGDFARDRIIPDCLRAAEKGEDIFVRNPNSTRPYQHVLEPLAVYLTIVMRQAQDAGLAGCYNVGPDDCDCVTTGELADLFVGAWGSGIRWSCPGQVRGPHEANFLKLDNRKIKETFGWQPVWHIERAVQETVNWQKALLQGGAQAANKELFRQIDAYLAAM